MVTRAGPSGQVYGVAWSCGQGDLRIGNLKRSLVCWMLQSCGIGPERQGKWLFVMFALLAEQGPVARGSSNCDKLEDASPQPIQ